MKHKLITIAAALLGLAACTSDDDMLAAYRNDAAAVRVAAQVGTASADGFTRSNPLGATDEAQKAFQENDQIKVGADGQEPVTYRYDGTEWLPQDGKYLKWESSTMLFQAYYPATFDGTVTQPMEYADEQSLAAADFMSFSDSQTNTGGNKLSLQMKRQMARVVVEIAGFNNQYPENTEVKSVKVKGVKAYKHAADITFAEHDLLYLDDAQKSVTLDLDDHTLKHTTNCIFTVNNGTLTIKNGKMQTTTNADNSVFIVSGGVVNVEKCTITGCLQSMYQYDGTVVLKECTLNGYLNVQGGLMTLSETQLDKGTETNTLQPNEGIEVMSTGRVDCDFDPTSYLLEESKAIQKGDNAWSVVCPVSTESNLAASINNGNDVYLGTDLTLTSSLPYVERSMTIDLGGHQLTYARATVLKMTQGTVTVQNGTLTSGSSFGAIEVNGGTLNVKKMHADRRRQSVLATE